MTEPRPVKDTKIRILDAAERLIAEHGLDVSLRTITADAGVNLAAVNYHFQSKDALWEAIMARRFEPINALRNAMLDDVEREFPAGPLPLERVLEAFLGPIIDVTEHESEHFRPMLGRLFTLPDEFLRRVFSRYMAPVVERFDLAFARALPELPPTDRLWRMMFSIGSMIHVMNSAQIMCAATQGRIDARDTRALKQRIIAFTAAGFRASVVANQGEKS